MDLEVSQRQYNDNTENLLTLINSIIEKGELSEEDKANIDNGKTDYNTSYMQVNKDIKDTEKSYLEAQLDYLKNQIADIKTNIIKDKDNIQLSVSGAVNNFSQIKQLIDKISLIVKDGESSSSITLTPYLIQLIADSDILLSAKKIDIKGKLIGTGWQVDEEGNLDINDLNVKGNVIINETLNVENVVCPNVQTVLDSTINKTLASGESLNEYLETIPLNLNGYSVNITLSTDLTENIELRRHTNGIVNIYLNGKTLNGYIKGTFNAAIYNIYGGSSSTSTTYGIIMPNTGNKIGSYYYSIVFSNCPNVNLYYLKVYGAYTNTDNTVGIGATNKTALYMENISFLNCKYNYRSYSMAKGYCDSSNGVSVGNSWSAGTGSELILNATTQAGGGSNTYTSGNGQIVSTGVTFATTSETGSNSSSGTGGTTTKVETFKPNSCATYRSTKYNDWASGVCRQGDWEYGNCNGAWFYGSQFAEVKGKNITKVTITVTRSSGVGYSSAVSHVFQAHSHSSRPAGMPSYTTCNNTLSLAWGESGTITITDTTVLNGISSGTIKGFGIKASYTKEYYSALTNGTVKVYYKE